jgi:hypothetical protein
VPRNAERRAHRAAGLEAVQHRFEQTLLVVNRLHGRGGRWPMQVKIRSPLFTGNPFSRPPIARMSAPRGVNLQVF